MLNRVPFIFYFLRFWKPRLMKKIFLISDDFSGHRLEWLNRLLDLSKRTNIKLCIATLDSNRILEGRLHQDTEIHFFSSRSEIRLYLKGLDSENDVVIWDGDRWLFSAFLIKHRLRMVIMRPYLRGLSIVSLCSFMTKRILIYFLFFFKDIKFAYLSIPYANKKTCVAVWVDDELLVPEDEIELFRNSKVSRPSNKDFKIVLPGYISARKNAELLIQSCLKLQKDGFLNFSLIIKGLIEEEERNKLLKYNYDWLQVDHVHLTSQEYFQLLSEADLVVLPYTNVGSSGVALECLNLGVPLIISRNRLWMNLQRNNPESVFLTDLSLTSLSNTIADAHNVTSNLIWKQRYVPQYGVSVLGFVMGLPH